jgi:Ca2+-binding RTX toxin-like protein
MAHGQRMEQYLARFNAMQAANQVRSNDSFGNQVITTETVNTPVSPTPSAMKSMRDGGEGERQNSHSWDNGSNQASQGATAGDDTLVGSKWSDNLSGAAGNDTLVDAGGSKATKMDSIAGGGGNDNIYTHFGADVVNGGAGDDVIISRSDAGEPLVAQGGATYYANQPFSGGVSNDKITGGDGADTFQFRFDLDAKAEILAKHQLAHAADEHGGPGVIDWAGVTGENGAPHLHWVQSIGNDTVTDFTRNIDKIELFGHTVAIGTIENNVDADGDHVNDDSIVHIISQQGANGGAHDEDSLGSISVLNVADIKAGEITIHDEAHLGAFESITDMPAAMRDWDSDDDSADGGTSGVATGGNDTLVGSKGRDWLDGAAGDDTLVDAGGMRRAKSDVFNGGDGKDTIYLHFGTDRANGGADDDTIVSRSDAGEPMPAQGGSAYNANQPFRGKASNDVLTGGAGSDTFQFRFDLDAKPEILAKHQLAHAADEHGGPGVIDWEGVTGENGGVHLHWVQSIGSDTITDFTRNVDKIELYGHTVDIGSIEKNVDADHDGLKDDSIVHVISQQGANGGAHDEDSLGSINVLNVADISTGDITIHADVHLGAFGSIDDMFVA